MSKLAIVSLTFDDGLRCQFERAVPILDEYGFVATFFIAANTDPVHTDGCSHPDWPKTDWSVQDQDTLKSMIRRGHEIGSHSVTHRHPHLDNDPKGEAENSKRWIEDRLGIEVSSYCYPFCCISPAIKNAVIDAGYKQARWGANATYHSAYDVDFFQVDCRFSGNNHARRDVGNQPIGGYGGEDVHAWVRPNSWHVLTFHGIGDLKDGWFPIPVEEFRRQMAELANFRKSGAVDVVTFREGADRLRQSQASLR